MDLLTLYIQHHQVVLMEAINARNIHGFRGMPLNLDSTKKITFPWSTQKKNTQLTNLPPTPFQGDSIPEHINM